MFEELIFQNIMDEGDNVPFLGVADENEPEHDGEMPDEFPIIALTNTVLYPGTVIPITIGREKSVAAIKTSKNGDKWIAAVTQRDKSVNDPSIEDLYQTGTVARVLKVLKMPDGTTTAIIQGRKRCTLENLTSEDPYLKGKFRILEEMTPENDLEFKATINSIREKAKRIIELSNQIPNEAVMMIENVSNDMFLLNFVATNLNVKVEKKQDLLET